MNTDDINYGRPSYVLYGYNSMNGQTDVKLTTFQGIMKRDLLIAQWFGLIPVLEVYNAQSPPLKWYSWRGVYSIVSLFGQCCFVVACFVNVLKFSNLISSSTHLVYYSSNFLVSAFFYRLAMNWPSLITAISKFEQFVPNEDAELVRKCRASRTVLLIFALTETVLSNLYRLSAALDCYTSNTFEAFAERTFPWMPQLVPYNLFIAIIAMIINVQFEFVWNFADIFLIYIGFYLTSKLKQVNKKISKIKGKNVPSNVWKSLREDYNRVAGVLRELDDNVSVIIFVTLSSNVFLICVQLLDALRGNLAVFESCQASPYHTSLLKGFEGLVFRLYSLVFVILRTFAVLMVVSQIRIISKEPIATLYVVPPESYGDEVKRFVDQVHDDTIALSGLGFFNVDRELILTIAATIMTYELVLLQFPVVEEASAQTSVYRTNTTI